MFDPRDRRTHPFFGGPGAAVGTQHGTRPPNVFVQSESSSDAERIFRVMNDNYHGRSWTRMKDCPRLRTMLSLLDSELEQILSVNKEVDVRWCARQSAIQRICVRVVCSSGSRESGGSVCHPSSAHTRTHPPVFRFFVANARTRPHPRPLPPLCSNREGSQRVRAWAGDGCYHCF